MKPQPTHLANANQIATACGVDNTTVKGWLGAPDFPPKTEHGYPRAAVMEFAAKKMAAHAAQITGEHADVKRQKIEAQVRKLNEDVRRAAAEADMAVRQNLIDAGKVVTITEHQMTLLSHARLVRHALQTFPRTLMSETRDPAAIKVAESVVFTTLEQLSEAMRVEGI